MTTLGYEAEPQDVAHLLHTQCGDLLTEPDPLIRYTRLTAEQALYDALVSAIKRERGRALAELAEGRSNTAVAELVGLGTRQRVEQLISAHLDGHYTADMGDTDMAQWIADMPQLAGNGHRVQVDGATVTLSGRALEVLAGLDSDNDGHYDGTGLWVGGDRYEVRPA